MCQKNKKIGVAHGKNDYQICIDKNCSAPYFN